MTVCQTASGNISQRNVLTSWIKHCENKAPSDLELFKRTSHDWALLIAHSIVTLCTFGLDLRLAYPEYAAWLFESACHLKVVLL